MASVLETKSLGKTYSSNGAAVQALRGVNLTVAPGEFVAVMGPSGCGKSTLLHLLGGLDRPSTGEVYVNGERVDRWTESRLALLRRRHIGFVFQFFNLIGNLNVADNVELPALLAGCKPQEARRRREQLLAALGLSGKHNAIPAQLSGGEQQRVALARALVNQPTVLLADEPTGNLDTNNAREVLGVLRQSHAQGQTIVLVTHDARVASAADRVLLMRDGEVVDETPLDTSEQPQNVLARFVQVEL
jgi:putative ABC transport system ATP-binding protein